MVTRIISLRISIVISYCHLIKCSKNSKSIASFLEKVLARPKECMKLEEIDREEMSKESIKALDVNPSILCLLLILHIVDTKKSHSFYQS